MFLVPTLPVQIASGHGWTSGRALHQMAVDLMPHVQSVQVLRGDRPEERTADAELVRKLGWEYDFGTEGREDPW